MADTIPIFPLEHVLLPGLPLPLHVFEPRYRQMLRDVEASGRTFGIVALRRGGETSIDVEVADVGTLAEVLEKQPYPDGSCDLLTVGSRRFRVIDLDASSRPYLQASVEWLAEEDGELAADLVPAAVEMFARYLVVLARLGTVAQQLEGELDPLRLSYELAVRVQLSLAQRQKLLEMPTASHRLAACLVVLRREIGLIERTRTIPMAAKALRIIPRWN